MKEHTQDSNHLELINLSILLESLLSWEEKMKNSVAAEKIPILPFSRARLKVSLKP